MSKMNTFVADELANKVKQLNKALAIANSTIEVLEEENNRLVELLELISNNKDVTLVTVM